MTQEKKLSPDQESELSRKYADGAPLSALATEYDVTRLTASRVVKRHGGTIRPKSPRITTDEQDREIAALYAQGVTTSQIAHRFNVPNQHVVKAVKRNGGEVRRKGPNRLTEEQERELVALYESGVATTTLAAQFGVYASTVVRVVRRSQSPVKPKWRRPPREFSAEEIQRMAELWQGGKSQHAIAQEIGTTQLIVSRVLRRAGVESGSGRRNETRGAENHQFKGGRVTAPGGYIAVLVGPDDEFASMRNRTGYVLEHRLVMARQLGRPLDPTDTVHHVNGDKTDNRPENLQLRSGRHGKGVVHRCRVCGSTDIESTRLASHGDG